MSNYLPPPAATNPIPNAESAALTCRGYTDSGCYVRCDKPATHGAYPPPTESEVPSIGCESHATEWVAAWRRQGWTASELRPLHNDGTDA